MDTQFISDKSLSFDCDLDLGRGNINSARDTLLYLSVKLIKFPSLFFFSYG